MTTADAPQTSDIGDTTMRLAEYLADLSYSDVPAEVIDRERWHFLDTLGCILYGVTTPWTQKLQRALGAIGELDHGSATILGTATATPPARAALINGMASHSMDYDDYCQDAGVHAGSAVVPCALAYSQAADEPCSGRDLLTALSAGVEVGVRSGYGIGRGSLFQGFHIAGWTGSFAGAATTSYLAGLSRDQTANAIAIAGTQGAGLMGAAFGAEVKRFHMGKAAESGFLAAALARESFTGDTRIFQERWGAIGPTMSDDYDIDAVTANLGRTYELLDKLSFKPYPSVGQTHPAITALSELIETNHLDGAEVSSIRVKTTPNAKEKSGWEFEPIGVMSAQSNIQYALATLLVDGAITLDAYTEDAIRRPEILERIDDITIAVDDALSDESGGFNARYNTIVEVDTATGDRYSNQVSLPKGFPDNPMSEDELIAKFTDQASRVLPQDTVEQTIAMVRDLENIDDISELIDPLTRQQS